MRRATRTTTEPALVFPDEGDPEDWRVEWFDEDGGCEVTVFYGPRTKERALAFPQNFYPAFREWEGRAA